MTFIFYPVVADSSRCVCCGDLVPSQIERQYNTSEGACLPFHTLVGYLLEGQKDILPYHAFAKS
jgi:hypothetical protein